MQHQWRSPSAWAEFYFQIKTTYNHDHIVPEKRKLQYKLVTDLHDGDSAVGDGRPVDGSEEDATGHVGAGLVDESVQHV